MRKSLHVADFRIFGTFHWARSHAREALEAVERYAQMLKVLRTREPQKSERELMESLACIREGDDTIEQIGARFAGVDPDEIEREAVKAVREVRAERAPAAPVETARLRSHS